MGGLEARLGIFARTFRRDTPAAVAAAVSAAGYRLAHWNFAAIGLPTLTTDAGRFDETAAAFGDRIPSVSATFNAIHPDVERRRAETAAAAALIRMAPRLGAGVVTLCTGTRDPDTMWRAHPGNTAPDAWADLRRTLDPLLDAASGAGVTLGVEPEPGNVVRDAATAARLLEELGDAPVGIVLDPANLLTPETAGRAAEILGEAVAVLGPRVVSMHAKDVVAGGSAAAGTSLMDWPATLRLLARVPPVPLIVQDVTEADAPRVRADLLRWNG